MRIIGYTITSTQPDRWLVTLKKANDEKIDLIPFTTFEVAYNAAEKAYNNQRKENNV
jgi:hypothetical protein